METFDNLSFEADGQLHNLPAWAKSLCSIADVLAGTTPSRQRLVVGVTLPTRMFAAAICLAAFVVSRERRSPSGEINVDGHFEMLCSLEKGTRVRRLHASGAEDGRIVGLGEWEGEERLCFETKGGTINYVTREGAVNIQVVGGDTAKTQLRSRKIEVPPLVESLIGEHESRYFVTGSRLDAVAVGVRNLLSDDLLWTGFTNNRGSSAPGRLQDLARAKGLTGLTEASRSQLITASGDEEEAADQEPVVAIFDGAAAFLNFGHLWRSSHHLVLLDRSRDSVMHGASAFNRGYYERVREVEVVGDVPPSLEVAAFESKAYL